MSIVPNWATDGGFADDTETDNTVRTSVYVRALPSSAVRTEGQTVIQIWATTNGRQFDSLTIDRETALLLIGQIALALKETPDA